MSSKNAVPDSWDDDWETQADQEPSPAKEEAPVKLSKSQRNELHDKANRQLWDSAETPETKPFFLAARETVPLQSDFKPAVRLLSRRPPPQEAADDDDDSGAEERKKAAEALAERQARAQREREAKLQKYAEARERLLGTASPASDDQQSRNSSRNSRGKGRGRGDRQHQGTSSTDQSPARMANQKKQLYDPNYTAKPNSIYIQKRGTPESSTTQGGPIDESQPIRAPRGPDGSGRGFAARGRGQASGAPI